MTNSHFYKELTIDDMTPCWLELIEVCHKDGMSREERNFSEEIVKNMETDALKSQEYEANLKCDLMSENFKRLAVSRNE